MNDQNPNADRACFYCHRKGHVKEERRIRMADESRRKDKRFKQKEKKRMNALEGQGQGNSGTSNSSTSQGEVQATVESNARFGRDLPAPECFDAGLRCSGECCAASANR